MLVLPYSVLSSRLCIKYLTVRILLQVRFQKAMEEKRRSSSTLPRGQNRLLRYSKFQTLKSSHKSTLNSLLLQTFRLLSQESIINDMPWQQPSACYTIHVSGKSFFLYYRVVQSFPRSRVRKNLPDGEKYTHLKADNTASSLGVSRETLSPAVCVLRVCFDGLKLDTFK